MFLAKPGFRLGQALFQPPPMLPDHGDVGPVAALASGLGERPRLLLRPDPAPLVGAVAHRALGLAIGQAVLVGAAILTVPGAAVLGDLDKPKRLHLADRRADGVTMDVIFHELVIGDGEVAVLLAAVLHVLDLDAVEHPAGREAERHPGGRYQHAEDVRHESLVDGLAVPALVHLDTPSSRSATHRSLSRTACRSVITWAV